MNLLHICTSESWGGLELYAATLIVELHKAGDNVIAVCKQNSPFEKFLASHDIQCYHLPSNLKVSLSSMKVLGKLMTTHSIEVVHVHFHRDIWMPSILLRSNRTTKLFLSIYMGVIKKNDLFHRWIYRRVDAFFTSSKQLNERLPSLYPIQEEKIHFLPYGRDIQKYHRDEVKRGAIRQQLGVSDSSLLVGTMVRIDPGKGALDFARSFSYLDQEVRENISYIIVGEPTRKASSGTGESPYEPHCEEYFEEIKKFIVTEKFANKIALVGYQDDIIGYLSAMDLFVFPSRDELYSLVVLDAMSMSLPVVAARAGGNMLQIEDGKSGLLYTVGDSADLAEKLLQYVRNPELRQQHGREARAFVERRHDMKETIGQLRKMYQHTSVDSLTSPPPEGIIGVGS